ncbi:hypothetical protein A1Q2_04931 [Trichosporon asahii var. asahii CBS 8904]|uniref:Uncharacterized protein n=1 Tax=Trichosporon asahii var. asahii (strain CBS 8904) TaxID=1220162 RepID=K1WH14_TRIAC|nr:hypothetical protein A1Q2_04931 [Trichosporon asahii var. asahii CBS 8904]
MPSPLNRVRAQHGLRPLPGPPRPVTSVDECNTILLALTQRQEEMIRRFHTREDGENLSPPTTPPSSP